MRGLAARDKRAPGRRCHLEFPGLRSDLVPRAWSSHPRPAQHTLEHPLGTLFQRLGTFGNQTGSLLPLKQGGKMKAKWEPGRLSTPQEKIAVQFHQPLLHLFLCLLHQQGASPLSMNCTVECIFLLLSLPDAIFQGLSSHEPKRD